MHFQRDSEFREIQCRFLRQSSVTRRQYACRVAHSPSSLSRAPHAHLAGSWHRQHPGPPSPASSAASGPPVAADRRQPCGTTPFCAALCSLALRVAHACQRTPAAPSPWPGKHRARPLPPTGPRRPVPSNPPRTPNPSSFSVKTEPEELHVDAKLPKPPRPSSTPP